MSRVKYILLVSVIAMASAFGQSTPTGTPVITSDAPTYEPWTKLFFTSGSNQYVCYAKQAQGSKAVTFSAVSNASPAVVTATAHGFSTATVPTVTISGGTGAWAAFNGTFIATPIDANSFSIPVNTSSFGAVAGTIVIKTTAPRTSDKVWMVYRVAANGSGVTQSAIWALGGWDNKCDDRETLSYQ